MPIDARIMSGWPGMVGASADFSTKSSTRPSSATLRTPSSRDWSFGTGKQAIVKSAWFSRWRGDHLGVVHLVDVVASEDQGIARGGLLDRVDVLVDRVGGPLIPLVAEALLRRDHLDVFVEFAAQELPTLVDVPVQADGLVLGQDQDLAKVGVQAIREREVDDPVDPAEGDRRLGPVTRQGFEARPPPPGEDDGQYIAEHLTTSSLDLSVIAVIYAQSRCRKRWCSLQIDPLYPAIAIQGPDGAKGLSPPALFSDTNPSNLLDNSRISHRQNFLRFHIAHSHDNDTLLISLPEDPPQ